jgi:hypothetical protein
MKVESGPGYNGATRRILCGNGAILYQFQYLGFDIVL